MLHNFNTEKYVTEHHYPNHVQMKLSKCISKFKDAREKKKKKKRKNSMRYLELLN